MKRFVLAISLISGFSSNVSATTISFQGQVAAVNAVLAPSFSVGESVGLAWDFQPTASSAQSAAYGFQNLSLVVGDDTFAVLSASTGLWVKNDVPFDEFGIGTPLIGLNLAGLDPPYLYLNMVDFTAFVFADASLPATIPPLSSWTVTAFLDYNDPVANASRRVEFTFSELTLADTPTTVPEPSSVALLAWGLAGIAARRRRQRKRVVRPPLGLR